MKYQQILGFSVQKYQIIMEMDHFSVVHCVFNQSSELLYA